QDADRILVAAAGAAAANINEDRRVAVPGGHAGPDLVLHLFLHVDEIDAPSRNDLSDRFTEVLLVLGNETGPLGLGTAVEGPEQSTAADDDDLVGRKLVLLLKQLHELAEIGRASCREMV